VSAAVSGLAALALLAAPGSAGGAVDSRGEPRPGGEPLPHLLRADARSGVPSDKVAGGFVGADGTVYDPAPVVVGGNGGELFYGPDFDSACADGAQFAAGLKRLAHLARIIADSGRRVVLTVAPNKSAVLDEDIDWPSLPHGLCTAIGLRQQQVALDTLDEPLYLPMRQLLTKDPRQTFYNTDSHWTSVGASVFFTQVASRLSDKLARDQIYLPTEQERQGDLFSLLGIPQPETAQAVVPQTQVSVQVAPPEPGAELQQAWTASPRKKVLPGQTLLIGDSFTYIDLDLGRTMFRHGRFIWIQPQNLDDITRHLADADTVVIEVLQRFVSTSIIETRAFRTAVRAALHP